MKTGVVYLIGAGPGDPALITVRGAQVLRRCDVVLYDALAHPTLLEYLRPGAQSHFVGKRGGMDSEQQAVINDALISLAREGKTVGRLKGGDPLLFARGAEETEMLADAGIPFEIVPGIPSPIAVSAYAGIPLTHRDAASNVVFLTGTAQHGMRFDENDKPKLVAHADTLCILMGMHRLEEIVASLIHYGRDPQTPAAIVQWGARPEQRTITAPLHALADKAKRENIGSPAVIIVGHVVKLREKLRWFDTKPLFGKRIVITRTREQSALLSEQLRERGAAPILVPTISVSPPDNPVPFQTAVAELRSYDWVTLTSANGVRALFAELDRQGKDARAFGNTRVAAIGPGTSAALQARGVRADVIAKEFRGEGLTDALLQAHGSGRPLRVLLPRARVARDALPHGIRAAGGEVEVVAAYETRLPKVSEVESLRYALEAGEVDAITLTSSSTVENLVLMLGEDALPLLASCTLASIGPITTATAERLGLRVAVTAQTYSIEGLLTALEEHFSLTP